MNHPLNQDEPPETKPLGGSLGLLVEACKTCDDSYENENEISRESSEGEEKDEQTKANNILYCKARGMPYDHIGQRAILQFEEGQARLHGAELLCSHPVCRAKGVKFRYCAVCQKAVAKRNFRKRHAHADTSQSLPSITMTTNKRKPLHPISRENQPQFHCRNVRGQTDNSFIPLLSKEEFSPPTLPSSSENGGKALYPPWMNTTCNKENEVHGSSIFTHSSPPELTNKSTVPPSWINLYHSRPVDGGEQQLKSWLMSVMNTAGLSNGYDGNLDILNSFCVPGMDGCSAVSSDHVAAIKEEFCGIAPPRLLRGFSDSKQSSSYLSNVSPIESSMDITTSSEGSNGDAENNYNGKDDTANQENINCYYL